MATSALGDQFDQWTSADTESVIKDLPRASLPQAILKFRPLSSLDYKARLGPQKTI